LGRQGQQLADLNEYDDILAMWCNAGDPVCAVGSEPINITAHWSYYEEYTNVASRWVVATVLGQTDVRLDLDLDGKDESIVLAGSAPTNSSNDNESRSGGGDEDAGLSLRSHSEGTLGFLGLVVLVTIGLGTMF
jgi:acetylxylan esterase